jgi:hypothetical protein
MANVLAYPLQITAGGRFATVDQDSNPEITQAAHIALLCPIGHRPLLPDYGMPNLEGTRAQVDRAGILASKVLTDEPRLRAVDDTEKFDQLVNSTVATLDPRR